MANRALTDFGPGLQVSVGVNAALGVVGAVLILFGGFGVLYVVAVIWVAALALTFVAAGIEAINPERRAHARGVLVGLLLAFVLEVVLGVVATALWMSMNPGAELS